MDIQTKIIIFAILIMFGAGAFMTIKDKVKKPRFKGVVKPKGKGRNHLFFMQVLFKNVPVLSQQYARTRKSIALIYPADSLSINKETTNLLAKTYIWAFVGIVLTWLITGNDIFYGLTGTYVVILIAQGRIRKKLNSYNRNLYAQFEVALGKIRHKYLSNNHDIVKALKETVYDSPFMIGLHLQKIHDILISKHMQYEIDKYKGNEPNQYISLLLTLSAAVKENGDKVIEGTSQTTFLKNLNNLKEDVENEILAMDENKARFAVEEILAIVPIFFVKPLELWAKHYIPNIAPYYGGLVGIVTITIVFMLSYIVYHRICNLRDGYLAENKFTSIWLKAYSLPIIKDIVDKYHARHYMELRIKGEHLNALGDFTGVKAFVTKKVMYALITFVATLFLFGSGIVATKYEALNDFSNDYNNTYVKSDDYREILEQTSIEYAKYYKNDRTLTEDTLKEQLLRDTDITAESVAAEVAKNVVDSIRRYQRATFWFFYIIIAVLLSALAFVVPDKSLKSNYKLIEMRQEEEIISYQTIIVSLMYMSGISVEKLLEWMERFSYCFRDQLAECRVTVNYGKKKALQKMKNQTIFEPFRQICDNMMDVDNVGIIKAFDEIATDREFSKEKRKATRMRLIKTRSDKAKRISLMPLYATALLTFVVPLFRFAIDLFSNVEQYM